MQVQALKCENCNRCIALLDPGAHNCALVNGSCGSCGHKTRVAATIEIFMAPTNANKLQEINVKLETDLGKLRNQLADAEKENGRLNLALRRATKE